LFESRRPNLPKRTEGFPTLITPQAAAKSITEAGTQSNEAETRTAPGAETSTAKQFPLLMRKRKEGRLFDVPGRVIAPLTRECGGNVHDRHVGAVRERQKGRISVRPVVTPIVGCQRALIGQPQAILSNCSGSRKFKNAAPQILKRTSSRLHRRLCFMKALSGLSGIFPLTHLVWGRLAQYSGM
jgi:hypothetical protein